MICDQFHSLQVFIVGFLVSLIDPMINNIYSLFVVCLDFHFSNPVSDPRMVLRWSRFLSRLLPVEPGHFDAKLEFM